MIGKENIPENGPVVIACNHNSQFVDAMMLVLAIDRPIHFIIAASSTKNGFLKGFLKLAKVIPAERPIDVRKKGSGIILIIKDNVLVGQDTLFSSQLKIGDAIRIYENRHEFAVIGVIDDTHVKVRIPEELSSQKNEDDKNWETRINRREFDVLPKMNQHNVHIKTIDVLSRGEVIGIFPEGGSHDQTQLLPLKAGACVFLWSAQEKGLNCPLVCVGVNYYGSHNFRSKVVVNIGPSQHLPLDPEKKEDKDYKYEYISNTLDKLKVEMESVKINTSSYQKLLTFNCAKEIFLEKKTKLDSRLDFLLLQKFCAGFEIIAKHKVSINLLEKMNLFRKKIKANGFKVKDLRNHDIFLKRNLIWVTVRFLVAVVLVN